MNITYFEEIGGIRVLLWEVDRRCGRRFRNNWILSLVWKYIWMQTRKYVRCIASSNIYYFPYCLSYHWVHGLFLFIQSKPKQISNLINPLYMAMNSKFLSIFPLCLCNTICFESRSQNSPTATNIRDKHLLFFAEKYIFLCIFAFWYTFNKNANYMLPIWFRTIVPGGSTDLFNASMRAEKQKILWANRTANQRNQSN